jgi:hypothetical protein
VGSGQVSISATVKLRDFSGVHHRFGLRPEEFLDFSETNRLAIALPLRATPSQGKWRLRRTDEGNGMTKSIHTGFFLARALPADGNGAALSKGITPVRSRDENSFSEDESAWNRFGMTPTQRSNSLSRRLLQGLCLTSAWLAMPLAVLTIHGWLGLLVHGLALSGAAGLLQKATIQARLGWQRLDSVEGDGACASMSKKL